MSLVLFVTILYSVPDPKYVTGFTDVKGSLSWFSSYSTQRKEGERTYYYTKTDPSLKRKEKTDSEDFWFSVILRHTVLGFSILMVLGSDVTPFWRYRLSLQNHISRGKNKLKINYRHGLLTVLNLSFSFPLLSLRSRRVPLVFFRLYVRYPSVVCNWFGGKRTFQPILCRERNFLGRQALQPVTVKSITTRRESLLVHPYLAHIRCLN